MVLFTKTALLIFTALLLSACSTTGEKGDGAPQGSVDISSVPDAIPRNEPRSRYGNPDSYVVLGKRYYVMRDSAGFRQKGIASWYGTKFHGRRTSSGETYNMYGMTAAHKTLPLPTYVEVTNIENGRSVIVKVNDRGPFHENRIIDLSYTAAAKLDILRSGTGLVDIRAIDANHYQKEPSAAGPVPVASGKKEFFIQVGSFGELLNAERLRSRLDSMGTDLVKISQVVVDGKTLYRVRIGPIYDIDFADSIVVKLDQFEIMDYRIVVD